MTEPLKQGSQTDADVTMQRVRENLPRRYRAETRFKLYGVLSLFIALLALAVLFADIFTKGYSAFVRTAVNLEFHYDPELMGVEHGASSAELMAANFDGVVKAALRQRFSDVKSRKDRRALNKLVSFGTVYVLRDRLLVDPSLLGAKETLWVLSSDDVDDYFKEFGSEAELPKSSRLSDRQLVWLTELRAANELRRQFNINFFTQGDSRNAEMAGVWGATVGSMLTLFVTLLLSFPIGVAAAVYLEEFARKSRVTEFIEVNINNLAAVPSIIFGLLGLAIFINFAGVPRSAPLAGGLVLTLMTLPTIIISSRASIKAVPPSLREAALGIGASRLQTVTHHVLPSAMPGMLTGAIVGMARALGETAPLLMIGMVAFIVDIPGSFTDSATVLPVQIYLWADSPERGFMALSSAAIMVLLVFLIVMNSVAVIMRRRLEKRW